MFARPTYVNAIMRFVDAPMIKVLTGIRRSGKSTILLMLIEELKKRGMGVLTVWDIESFSAYCQAYARWKEAEEFITQHGSIFKTPSGYVQQVPQVSIAQQNLKIMQSLAGEFGLSPATRSRIIAAGGGAGGKDAEDPMEQLLNGAWKEGG